MRTEPAGRYEIPMLTEAGLREPAPGVECLDGEVWPLRHTDRYVVCDPDGTIVDGLTLTLEEKDRLVELWQEPGRRSVRLSEIRRKSIPESVYEEFAEALSKASGLSVGVIRGDMSAPLMRVESPTTIDLELEALIDCMRPSAQETLESLHRHGWELRRR